MKYVLMAFTIVFVFSGCAGMKFENYAFTPEETLFMSDFSSYPDRISHMNNAKLEDGAVHSRAPVGQSSYWKVHVPFGYGTRVSFKLMLGEKINPPHPASHINFFTTEDTRLCINFDQNGIGYFENHGEDMIFGTHTEKHLPTGEWMDLDIYLYDSEAVVFLNGSKAKTISISNRINEDGTLGIECHNEIWLDDLEIIGFDSYVVLK